MNPLNNYAAKTQRYLVNSRASLADKLRVIAMPFLLC